MTTMEKGRVLHQIFEKLYSGLPNNVNAMAVL
jgi:hypothetical protein